jgi:DNA polymerase I-like protein with 3'-5' exonuclease and polymerase domains
MLINIDVKGLEIVVAAYLSQDPILMQELQTGVDIHEDNRVKFGLPTRLIAKVLGFRILYGGTEHSFVRDPDFTSVSSNKKYWAKAIEAYYDKYKGIKQWHTRLVQEATTMGTIISPTGRTYHYSPKTTAWGTEWPITTIKNYIVQGLGADLVMIARISLYNRLKKLGLQSKLVATVHDSIVIDCPHEEWLQVASIGLQCVRDVPLNFERLFGQPFNLSLNAEVLYGETLGDMKEWHENTYSM